MESFANCVLGDWKAYYSGYDWTVSNYLQEWQFPFGLRYSPISSFQWQSCFHFIYYFKLLTTFFNIKCCFLFHCMLALRISRRDEFLETGTRCMWKQLLKAQDVSESKHGEHMLKSSLVGRWLNCILQQTCFSTAKFLALVWNHIFRVHGVKKKYLYYFCICHTTELSCKRGNMVANVRTGRLQRLWVSLPLRR